MGGDDQARRKLRTAGGRPSGVPVVPDCEVREGDDETVDRRAVNPVQKSGLRARTIYLGTARADLIMAWPQQRPTCKRPDTFVQTASSSLNDLARAGRVIHFLTKARVALQHPASARPAASSA